MQYTITGLSFSDVQNIHSYYHPRTILTSTYFNKNTGLYTVTITTHAILKINTGDITLDLGAKLLTIPASNYTTLSVS